jgi:hypothetical protein
MWQGVAIRELGVEKTWRKKLGGKINSGAVSRIRKEGCK